MQVKFEMRADAAGQDLMFDAVYQGDVDALMDDNGQAAIEGLAGLAIANGAKLVRHTEHGAIWECTPAQAKTLEANKPEWASIAEHHQTFRVWWLSDGPDKFYPLEDVAKVANDFGFDADRVRPGCDFVIKRDGEPLFGVMMDP